ncbi:MAG: his operon leader peptide [Symbiopectobacterium sp.]
MLRVLFNHHHHHHHPD